jgi:hypothetical protein
MVGAFEIVRRRNVRSESGMPRWGQASRRAKAWPWLSRSDDQRLFEQRRLRKLRSMDLTCRERAVPETEEHERIGCLPPQRAKVGPAGGPGLGLEWKVVGHGNK